MGATVDEKLGRFLRKQRGTRTYAQFSRKTGLTPSTLHRLENGQQSITLRALQQLMTRLKVSFEDVFGA